MQAYERATKIVFIPLKIAGLVQRSQSCLPWDGGYLARRGGSSVTTAAVTLCDKYRSQWQLGRKLV